MKIRSDFVTNSSSSSFIIGKKDNMFVTIETVYEVVRKLYKDFLSARDKAIEYIAKHPKMKFQYVQKDDYGTFECMEKDSKKRWKLYDQFEKKCGFSSWECFSNFDWLDCETYLDYERYWLDKMKDSKDWRVHAPFTIADFLENRDIEWLHFHFDPEYDTRTHRVDSTSSVLGWYFPYIEEAWQHPDNCEGCQNIECCEYCKEDCAEQRKLIAGNNIPEDKACLYLLGRVCIHSESGYMPEYVVDKLGEISEHYCNHMG